ncbi:MAG: sugar transferase [Bacteroidetes bacterium]|nr:sugar transferase [Bacteroidota bacterium]
MGETFYTQYLKPLLDVLFAIIVLPFAFIISILVVLVLSFTNSGKILFTQSRIGKGERPFTIYKFRTLTDLKDSKGSTLPDAERQFAVGNFIRQMHWDEVPQLINILKGDLSFIGARPLLPEYLPHYSTQQQQRHLAKPGLTGLSQIKGGNALSWQHRLRYDSFYASHISFGLDAYILYRTIIYVLFEKNKTSISTSFIDSINKNKV